MDKKLSAVFQYLLYYQKTLIILHTGGYYMKLLIVRHGDPDYTIDSLTPKGWKEVDYLSEKLAKLDVKAFYVSPLGRARDTASLTLKKMNRTATEEPWLREFDALYDSTAFFAIRSFLPVTREVLVFPSFIR